MKPEEIDIDWIYLIERIESLIDLGEELLSRRVAGVKLEPQTLAQSLAFVWIRDGAGGFILEATSPDTHPLSDLIGIEKNIATLCRNSLQFILGYPANYVLLWGEKGSGKSSCIKGLLHEFSLLGLRLIEIRKEDLDQLPLILAPFRALPYRFILFCDNLSFSVMTTPAKSSKDFSMAASKVVRKISSSMPPAIAATFVLSSCRRIPVAEKSIRKKPSPNDSRWPIDSGCDCPFTR
jgi:predicted AAA+ superfamily ATPase